MVIKRLHLYYDIKLVNFGIDKDRNLIIQFPVFIQPYTQQPLIFYQIETVPIPIIDQNMQAHSYTHLQIDKPYIALNSETYITIRQARIKNLQENRLWILLWGTLCDKTQIQIQLWKCNILQPGLKYHQGKLLIQFLLQQNRYHPYCTRWWEWDHIGKLA